MQRRPFHLAALTSVWIAGGFLHAQASAQSFEDLRARCSAYGFAIGTAEHARCVERLDNRQEEMARSGLCASARRQADYRCGPEGRAILGPGLRTLQKCRDATALVSQHC